MTDLMTNLDHAAPARRAENVRSSPTVLQAVERFLTVKRKDYGGPIWTSDMEVQISVSAGTGEPVADRRNTWSDGLDTWFPIRVPKNADSEPHFRDYPMPFVLDLHAEAIGSTGWDWRNLRSIWVGFDYDAITGHAAGVGISAEELERVRIAASALPFVETRKSSGGDGLHIFAYTDRIATSTHTEHAALARAILCLMSTAAGFDFASRIDACGGNMWLWHKKRTQANDGFAVIKRAETRITAADLPPNWRDHLDVVTRKRSKVQVRGVDSADEAQFDEFACGQTRVPLDDQHRKHIQALNETGYSTNWVADYHSLHAHTIALKQVHSALNLKGVFETASSGSTPANCFLFPQPNGAWRVYRFGRNVAEAQTWARDEWTWCWFNRPVDWQTAMRVAGGIEDEKSAIAGNAAQVGTALRSLGYDCSIPDHLADRPAKLRQQKDGKLIARIERHGNESLPGWVHNRGNWTRVFTDDSPRQTDQLDKVDKFVRVAVTTSNEAAGYFIPLDGGWQRQPASAVKQSIQSHGKSKDEADEIMGHAARRPWRIVNLPFQSEFPGGRQWNRDGAQFRVAPAIGHDLLHLHWDQIYDHIGDELTAALRKLPWAKEANIRCGGDYLRAYSACVIRQPFEPLPYLFLHSAENCGKSIFWEAHELLIDRGIVKADRALTNQSDFNGELAGAILCVIEEKNIAAAPGALNKIRDAVTAKTLSIRRMRTDSYSQPNTTHWIQCSNDPTACPIFPGDTRITAIHVGALAAEIPKAILLDRLREEAPAFMRTLLDLQLPPLLGRLRLPIVETDGKRAAQETRRDPVERFVHAHCRFDKPEAITSKLAIRAAFNVFADCRGLDEVDESQSAIIKWGRRFVQACGNRLVNQPKDIRTEMLDGKREPGYLGVYLAPVADIGGSLRLHSPGAECCVA